MAHNIIKANAEIKGILKKYSLEMGYEITFPIYNILPKEVELALSVLIKHGMKASLKLKPVNNPIASK